MIARDLVDACVRSCEPYGGWPSSSSSSSGSGRRRRRLASATASASSSNVIEFRPCHHSGGIACRFRRSHCHRNPGTLCGRRRRLLPRPRRPLPPRDRAGSARAGAARRCLGGAAEIVVEHAKTGFIAFDTADAAHVGDQQALSLCAIPESAGIGEACSVPENCRHPNRISHPAGCRRAAPVVALTSSPSRLK